jgi:hypothetical protein
VYICIHMYIYIYATCLMYCVSLLICTATLVGIPVAPVKLASFDKYQRRLIVTGYDNSIRFWNFYSGQFLIKVDPQLIIIDSRGYTKLGPDEKLTCVSYEVALVGKRKLQRKLLLAGTEQGKPLYPSNSLVRQLAFQILHLV